MTDQQLMPINMDTIRELRLSGRRAEANKLVQAFRKNCDKLKAQEKKELNTVHRKKREMLHYRSGLCRYAGCERIRQHKRKFCKECLHMLNEKNKKNQREKKQHEKEKSTYTEH